MKILSIKPNITFVGNKESNKQINNSKAAFIIPLIVLATSPLTDSCSKIEPLPADVFEKQDTTEIVEKPEPGFDIIIDTTTNTIIHEIEI